MVWGVQSPAVLSLWIVFKHQRFPYHLVQQFLLTPSWCRYRAPGQAFFCSLTVPHATDHIQMFVYQTDIVVKLILFFYWLNQCLYSCWPGLFHSSRFPCCLLNFIRKVVYWCLCLESHCWYHLSIYTSLVDQVVAEHGKMFSSHCSRRNDLFGTLIKSKCQLLMHGTSR